jgi:hypothetical protein
MYGALRAPTSNCVVLLAQGDLGHILEVAQQLQGLLVPARRISGDERTEHGGRTDNWYSRGLIPLAVSWYLYDTGIELFLGTHGTECETQYRKEPQNKIFVKAGRKTLLVESWLQHTFLTK